MPKIRPDQYLCIFLFVVVALFIPISTPPPVRALKSITKLEPLPQLAEGFLFPIIKTSNTPTPILSAKAAIVYDLDNASILFNKEIDTQLPEASLTKLMTALVAVDVYAPNEIVRIEHNEFNTESNVMGLRSFEDISVDSLLQGLLIYSANDAALALAHHHPQGYDAFISAMNTKAKELHLNHTQFKNPVGFDDNNHYSTAYDLVILSKQALDNPQLASYLGTQSATVTDINGTIQHPLTTTNQLLHKLQGVVAGKTGVTPIAGECLFTEVTRDKHTIVTVVLGSNDRFADTTALVNWVYNEYEWRSPVQNQIE